MILDSDARKKFTLHLAYSSLSRTDVAAGVLSLHHLLPRLPVAGVAVGDGMGEGLDFF